MLLTAFIAALNFKKPGGEYTNKYKKFRLRIMLNKMKLS